MIRESHNPETATRLSAVLMAASVALGATACTSEAHFKPTDNYIIQITGDPDEGLNFRTGIYEDGGRLVMDRVALNLTPSDIETIGSRYTRKLPGDTIKITSGQKIAHYIDGDEAWFELPSKAVTDAACAGDVTVKVTDPNAIKTIEQAQNVCEKAEKALGEIATVVVMPKAFQFKDEANTN